jgi:hypothetical protein
MALSSSAFVDVHVVSITAVGDSFSQICPAWCP